jgi:hypothetical protein
MENQRTDVGTMVLLNGVGVALAYILLGVSLWLSPDVPLSTKGYWGMGIVLLTLSLINLVKYKFDQRISQERLSRIQDMKNEKMLEDAINMDN